MTSGSDSPVSKVDNKLKRRPSLLSQAEIIRIFFVKDRENKD